MATLSAEFSVEGSSAVQEHTVAYGATVDLAALSLSFRTIAWEIVSSSKSGATAPSLTLAGTPLGATASFPQVSDPGDGLGRAWLVKCTQTDSQGNQAVAYRVAGTVNARGRLPICADEENHRDATHGWSQSYNAMLASEGTGDLDGPASSVSQNIAVFSGTSGKNVADGGLTLANIGEAANPILHGAVGDGTTNDKTAILAAITTGVAAGVPVNGYGKTYGITGNMTLVANAWLQDIKFKQLTPAAGTVRTLTSAGGDNIRLERVTVDRNGDGTNGVHGVDAGIYIDGGTNHHFEDVEVFGDDIGVGFAIRGATYSDLVRVHVHDINYLLGADPLNDRINGIYIVECTDVRLINCRSHDLGGDFGGGATLRWSRGFTFSGNFGTQIHGCRAWKVDQGYDTTGGGTGNNRFQFADCFATDCLLAGFKFSNTARDGQVDNCTAERCYLWGFVVNGPTGAGMTATASSDIQFTDCTAYDIGFPVSPGVPAAGTKVGFRAMNGTFDIDSTVGIRFVGCKALDRQATRTMSYGFENEISASVVSPAAGKYNEAIGCVSVGHLGRAFQNMNEPRCDVSRVAVQSIPTATWEVVNWTADVDLGAMHDTVTSNQNVTARRDGNYRSTWGVVFAANATGQRGVRILREGTVIPGTTVLVDAAAAGETALKTDWTSAMGAGDSLRIEVFQNSGAALDLQTTSGGVVEQVG